MHDVIVVGVGAMGSATVYQLASRGLRVLGLERFTIPHEMGSSHGLTRIIRLAYHEGPEYVPIGRRAYALWRELEERTGERLLHITGSVHAGAPGAVAFERTRESCIAQGVSHEVLSAADLAARFSAYRLPTEMMALLQGDGGFLAAERCIEAHVAVARAQGAEVREGERVVEWAPTASGVRVRTDRGVYEAGALVLTVGAWAGKLLPELEAVAVPKRQVMAWFEPRRPELFDPARFPVFVLTWRGREHYGFPTFGIPGFKVGRFDGNGGTADPDALDRSRRAADEEALRDFTAHCFPDALGPMLRHSACMFTNSPDGHSIIGKHEMYPQVSFAAGFSGHGFKFSSAVGEILADLAERGESRHDVALFAPGRFRTGDVGGGEPGERRDRQVPKSGD